MISDRMNKMIRMEEEGKTDETPQTYDLAGKVIGFAMKVHSNLGPGFLESVYQNALALELGRAGMKIEAEKAISVFYQGGLVGAFVADLFVNDVLIVENLTRLHQLSPGFVYQFSFLPLALSGLDGSPVRAIAWHSV